MRTGGSRRIESRTRDELWAVVALLAGVFLALASLPAPVEVTGAVGALIGGGLRSLFGAGAAAVPVVPLAWSIALFGHFERPFGRRVTVLLAGLALAVPFTLGVIWQFTDPAALVLLDAGRQAPEYPVWVGLIGGLLAYYLRVLGPVGEGLLALGIFSALTISTIGWNPLGGLRKREAAA